MTPIQATFLFCPRCGHSCRNDEPHHRSANSPPEDANPFRCQGCGFTYYFSPTVAVGAILRDGSNVLFLVRGKDPGKGKYGLPGGFVDAGETLEESLQREVHEETALEVTQKHYLCSFPNQYVYHGVQVEVTDTFFLCEVDSLDPLKPQQGEVEELRWLVPTPETLGRMAFESNRRAIEFYLKHHSS